MKSLQERAKEFSISLPLMKDREKADFARLHNTTVTINDYGFMLEGEKEYVAFTIKEDKKSFYFGGQVLTDQIKQLDGEGYGEDIRKNGLPVLFGEKKSKEGRKYTTVQFYPEAK